MNAIVSALGGAQLSETEFRSQHEQSKRTDDDKYSVSLMYKVYSIIPPKQVDGFINNVLLLESIDANRGSSELLQYINGVLDDSSYEYYYDPEFAKDKARRAGFYANNTAHFNIPNENYSVLDGSIGHTITSMSIGDYLGVDTPSGVTSVLSTSGRTPIIDISPDATISDVKDFIDNGIFTIELIPEEDRPEFTAEAIKYANGGTSNVKYNRIFNSIGISKVNYISNSSNYIGSNRTIISGGSVVGSYTVNSSGEFEMNDLNILPFVSAVNLDRVVINSANESIASELRDLGYDCCIIKGKLIIISNLRTVRMSVAEADMAIDKFQSSIKKEAISFFSNVKSSHRVISPSLSMLLDSTSMDLPELVSWISRSFEDSKKYIFNQIAIANKTIRYDSIDSDEFTSMHVIEDELIPFLRSIITIMSDSSISDEFKRDITAVSEAISEIDTRVNAFNAIYSKGLDKYLVDRFGFDDSIFNDSDSNSRNDIKEWLYYIKYPEKSTNYHVRKAVSVIKDMTSEVAFKSSNYKKVDKLLSKLKKHGISDFGFIYEKSISGLELLGSATGFAMDNIHWGSFRRNLDSFAKYLGKETSAKKWSANGLYDRSVPSEHWAEYRRIVNDWLLENTVLPMDQSYTDAISQLSKETYIQYTDSRAHLSAIFSDITASDIANKTTIYHEFVVAYKEYLQLFSEYNSDGDLKADVSSKQYSMYVELARFKDVFNPTSANSSSSKFDDLKLELSEKLKKGDINAAEHARMLSVFSGFAQGQDNKKSSVSQFRELVKASTAAGMDQYAFSNSSEALREALFDLYNDEEASGYVNSKEYYDILNKYKKLYPSTVTTSGVKVNPWLTELSKIGAVRITSGSDYIVNPLFYIPNSQQSDSNVPSSVFSFDSSTFIGESSNDMFDNNSMYSMQPRPDRYFNPKYDKLSDLQKEIIDDVKEILVDINKNNGTISLYGPMLPQISTGMLSRGVRRFQSKMQDTYNPITSLFSSLIWPFKTKWFYNNESMTSVTGFRKGNNIPSSLFSKNSQILEDTNTISRDIVHLLSVSHRDSLINLVATKKLFAIKNIIDAANGANGNKSPGAAKLIASITRTFFGTEDILEGGHKKGQFDWGSFISSIIQPIRGVGLAGKWLTIGANAYNAIMTTANDGTFINRSDLKKSFGKAIHGSFSYAINKLTSKTADDPEIVKMMRLSGVVSDPNERHEVAYGKRFYKFITKHFLYGPYQLSDALSLYPISDAVFRSMKYYDGNFHTKYEFIDKFADRDDRGVITNIARKNAIRLYNSLDKYNEKFYNGEFISEKDFIEKELVDFYSNNNDSSLTYSKALKRAKKAYKKIGKSVNLYDAFEFDSDGVASLKSEYSGSNAIKALETARSIIKLKHRVVAGNKSESLSPSVDNVFSPQLFMYKGWQINAINMLFSRTYYDPIVKESIESQYISSYKLMMKGLSYIPVLGNMIRYYEGQNGETLDRREINQYQIDNGIIIARSMAAFILHSITGTILLAMALDKINGGGDDEDEIMFDENMNPVEKDNSIHWTTRLMKNSAVLLLRVSQEIVGLYNPIELANFFGNGNPLVTYFDKAIESISMKLTDYEELIEDPNSIDYEESFDDDFKELSGKTISQWSTENAASYMIPGVAGYKQTTEALFGPQGSTADPQFIFKDYLFGKIAPIVAPNLMGEFNEEPTDKRQFIPIVNDNNDISDKESNIMFR